jgi:hypothetical protein
LYVFIGADYIHRIIPSSNILTIVKSGQIISQHTDEKVREVLNTTAVRITAVR